MRRLIALILCVFMASGFGVMAFADQEITIYVNGSIVQSEVKPVVVNGNTLIPIRPVAEAMGCTVTWLAEEQGVLIESQNVTLSMLIDDDIVYTKNTESNDKIMQFLAVAPMIINGSAYIPMRAMVESLGGDVTWDGETKTIYVTYDSSTAVNKYSSSTGTGRAILSGALENAENGEYTGDMKNGLPDGTGTLTYTDENGGVVVFEGKWSEGDAVSGSLQYTSDTTSYIFEGDIETQEGQLILYVEDGGVQYGYEGGFNANGFNGYGEYAYLLNGEEGFMYKGEYADGVKSGTGTYTYKSSEISYVYEGEFKDDNFHGSGKVTFDDGSVLYGIFENGELIEYSDEA
ncbi:MAG: hypothetical protein LUC97_07600 [Clostridiales bacterium]|nr:hypothetical protein [Clostridiales bacterium]